MTVFEIVYPGTRLELADRDAAFRVQGYLSTIESRLNEAAMAMSLFEETLKRDKDGSESSRALSDDRDDVDFGALLREYGSDGQAFVREWSRRKIDAKRARWASGEIPRAYSSTLPVVYARSFLFSVWTIGKLFEQISKSPEIPAAVADVAKEFDSAFSALKPLRDSSAHIDERLAGRAHGKLIELKPIESKFINAPGGGILVAEVLLGNRFTGTTADGGLAEITIGVETLKRVQAHFQELLNSLSWAGPARLHPE